MSDRLEIICELFVDNRGYYVDKDENYYRVASDVKLPHHPIINYKKYNKKEYFELIGSDEEELLDKLKEMYKDEKRQL